MKTASSSELCRPNTKSNNTIVRIIMKKTISITSCGRTLAERSGWLGWVGGLAGIMVTAIAQEGTLEIQSAALLTWPESAPSQVVLESTTAQGPWTICPRPTHRSPGLLQLAVPSTDRSQFFKLCPGYQVVESFDDGNLDQWSKIYPLGGETDFEISHPNGALRVSGILKAGNLLALEPAQAWLPADARDISDFISSVDILDWGAAQTQVLTLAARVGPPPTYDQVTAGITFREPRWEAAGRDALWLTYSRNGISTDVAHWVFDADRATGYRLVLNGTGPKITCELYQLTNLEAPVQMLTGNIPLVAGGLGLTFSDALGASASHPFEITVDNVCFTGTLP